MDQEQAPDAPTSSGTKKLNARAPVFVPRSSSSAFRPPPPIMQHTYPAHPPFMPPPYYGFDNFYLQNVISIYGGFNGGPSSHSDLALTPDRDIDTGAAATASTKKGLSDAQQKILNQVEFYFSDINLATTDQLYRYMSKDPDGYVPISVVASFKKIKSAVNGSKQLASILRNSKKLLVSEDGKNVKRHHLLTESDMEELQSRIVIAENLPEDHSHLNLMKIFSSVGSVKSIRTCPPQKYNGVSSASKTANGDAMHFSSKFHAFVEYESVEVAEKAVIELKDAADWRNGLKVRLLLKSAAKTVQPQAKKVGHEGQPTSRKDEEMRHYEENNWEDSMVSDNQFPECRSEDNESSNVQTKKYNHFNRSSYGNGNGRGKGLGRGRSQQQSNGSILGSQSLEVSVATEKLTVSKTSPVPRMPDGTKGFSMGRGKAVAAKVA